MGENTIFIISQCIAALAFCAGLLGFQSREHNKVLKYFAMCSFLTSAHFIMLMAWTAAAVIFISGIRHLAAMYYRRRNAMYFFFLVLLISTIATYEKPLNLLAAFSAFLGTIGSFSRNTAKARKVWMISSVSYVIHNYLVHSPVAMCMELVFLLSNIIAYRRYFAGRDIKDF